eukprot:3251067-Amphidinium_carterae.2
MKVNLKKTVVICNGANAKRLLMKAWRVGWLPPPKVTTRDLGVDTLPHAMGGLEVPNPKEESDYL